MAQKYLDTRAEAGGSQDEGDGEEEEDTKQGELGSAWDRQGCNARND